MKNSAVLVLFVFSILSCSEPAKSDVFFNRPFGSDYISKKYSKQQIRDDIEFMLRTIKETHVDFYHTFNKTQLTSKVDIVIKNLKDSSDIYDAIFAISSVSAMFNEGHLGMVWNTETYKRYSSFDGRFPFSRIRITDSTLVVKKDLSEKPVLDITDRITAINDIPVSVLVKKFRGYYGGTDEWKTSRVSGNFGYLLFIDKIYPPYKIKAIHNGREIEFVSTDLLKLPTDTAASHQPKFAFRYSVLDPGVAYIDFISMTGDVQTFLDSLKSTFTDIHNKGVKKLIIDLRKNGGGDSRFGEYLLSYINDKPYRMSGGMKAKSSSLIKQNFRRGNNPKMMKALTYMVPSGIVINDIEKVKVHDKSEPFFSGKICFLIGINTFSSANMLANAIQDYNLATLIGDNTGEVPNDYGEIIDFMLPNTQLIARAPCKKWIRANGNAEDKNPVIPNIKIQSGDSDMRTGRDAVLDFAKVWVSENKVD